MQTIVTMKFPKSIIDINEHQDKIYKLVKDSETTIFIDTNIIALLYKLNAKSRKEFFDWVTAIKERIKIPSWVVNEYSNKFNSNNILCNYLSSLTVLKEVMNKYNDIYKFLNLYIDDSVINKANKYDNIDSLYKDIENIKNIFEKISFLLKTNSDFIHRVHSEIEENLKDCCICSNIDFLIYHTERTSNIRYEHRIPPGYQDSKKEFNSFGDLILWKEILEYSKKQDIKKVVFLTNDSKKDWLYTPIKIKNSKGEQFNSNYKIIDNRLVSEFQIITHSEDIEIVNFEQLVKIIIEKEPENHPFSELGRALQIINTNNKEQIENTDVQNEITDSENDNNERQEVIGSNSDEDVFDLDETALRDAYIDLSDESNLLVKTIDGLRSHDWYVQNPALDNFLEQIKRYSFKNDKIERTRLFVVGRNIYQALCGNSRAAYDFVINKFGYFIQHTQEYIINLLIGGMFYEIYFNSKNEFRENKFKSSYLDELIKQEDNPKLDKAKDFIQSKLEPYKEKLVYIPFSKDNVDVQLTFKFDQAKETKFYNRNIPISVKINNEEFLISNEANCLYNNSKIFDSLNHFKRTILSSYAIPEIKVHFKEEGYNKDVLICLEDKNFKKL